MTRELALGVAFSLAILWLTFFSSPGSVEIATLVAAVVALIWFASVDPHRLTDGRRRPHVMLFGLASLGAMVVVVAASVISTGTLFLTGAVTLGGATIGFVRAVRFGLDGGEGGS